MTSASHPGHPIDFPTLLRAAAEVPGSPRIDDYGVPFAATQRHGARMLDQDVYWGAHLKAAVVLDTLLRHPWLERGQASASWAAMAAVLDVNGYRVSSETKDAEITTLARAIAGPGVPLLEIARTLRNWTVSV